MVNQVEGRSVNTCMEGNCGGPQRQINEHTNLNWMIFTKLARLNFL